MKIIRNLQIWHVEKSKSILNLTSGNIRVIEKDSLDLFPLNKIFKN
jgi:hypothetical protein